MAMSSFQTSFVAPHQMHDSSIHAGMASPTVAVSNASATMGNPQQITAHEAVEVAGRNIEKMIHNDSQFPSLAEKLRIGELIKIISYQIALFFKINENVLISF